VAAALVVLVAEAAVAAAPAGDGKISL